MDFDVIVQKIVEKTASNYDDVQRLILNKQQELSNLVSKDGAAYIVAKELGIDLFEVHNRRLEIKNVIPGIKNLNLTARLFRIFPKKEFEYDGRKACVANIILSDQTGTIRMSLWDTQLKILDTLKVGQAVEISGAYTRDNNGVPEVRLSRKGEIKVVETCDIPLLVKQEAKCVTISNVVSGDTYEVRAAIVQIFNSNLLYEVCPTCKTKARKEGNDFVCKTHGKVTPDWLVILNGVIDDGTGNMKVVFFRDNALKVMGMTIDHVVANRTEVLNELKILGKEFIFTGTLKKNKLLNKDEFVVTGIKDVDVKNEINNIMNTLKK